LPVKGGGGKDVAEDADANFLHRSSPIRNKRIAPLERFTFDRFEKCTRTKLRGTMFSLENQDRGLTRVIGQSQMSETVSFLT
jgi:hypothetical protein